MAEQEEEFILDRIRREDKLEDWESVVLFIYLMYSGDPRRSDMTDPDISEKWRMISDVALFRALSGWDKARTQAAFDFAEEGGFVAKVPIEEARKDGIVN